MSPKATSQSKWKIPYISDTLLNTAGSSVPFLAVTESWLKSYIHDAQVDIPNYSVLRSDRAARVGGGALLYIHDSLLVSEVQTFDDGVCQSVVCSIETLNYIVASVYWPPNANYTSFLETMSGAKIAISILQATSTFLTVT